MKVVGFSFIRNAITYDYPIVEAIRSILPVCDEVVIAVGDSDDDTLKLVAAIEPTKVRILRTTWDDNLREGGRVLAVETDKAFQAIAEDADWAFYIQGDEVLHEKYHAEVLDKMRLYLDDTRVEGLLFNYLHFYGSYDYVGDSLTWYRKEIRVIRNHKSIFSYRDAQGFRKKPNDKLNVKQIDATIHHYGWVKDPRAMQGKLKSFNKYWHSDEWVAENIADAEEFDYSKVDSVRPFDGTHPEVMKRRIDAMNWKFARDMSKNNMKLKYRIKMWVEKHTGWRPSEYKNYRVI